VVPATLSAQNTIEQSYSFVNVPSFARLNAMGGYLVSQPDTDVSLVMTNPAQSGDSLNGMLAISYLDYLADVNKFQFAYQHKLGKAGSWFAAVDHIAYGDIEGFDDTGQSTGEFRSNETMLLVGTSHVISHFRLGASLKFLSSSIAGFGASAMTLDLGGTFKHPEKDLSVGLVFQNIGFVLSDYDEGSNSNVPFNLQAGVSFKPEYMPLRFHFTLFQLTDWGTPSGLEEPGTLDMVLRHINMGAEVLLHKNVDVRFGYNHRRRYDLRLDNAAGGAGFSFGIRFKMRSFSFAYARGGYHVAGGSNNFTLILNTNALFKKRIEL
jgi:hypothetical protein